MQRWDENDSTVMVFSAFSDGLSSTMGYLLAEGLGQAVPGGDR